MTGTLPPWLERLLGIPAAASGEGTAWTLDHSWAWAPWATLIFAALVAGWVLWCYAREPSSAGRGYRLLLAALRLSLAAIVLFMLAGFVLTLHRTGLPYVVVIVDDSTSMSTVDRYDDAQLRELVAERLRAAGLEQASRLNLAKGLLLADRAAWLRTMSERYKLKVYFLAATTRRQPSDLEELVPRLKDLEATGEATRLGQGVQDVLADLRGAPPSAVVLLTDGINTEGPTLTEAAAQARRKGVPLFTVALGSDTPQRHLELGDLLVDDVVFVDDVVTFEFKLTATGLEGRPFQVTLHEKDRDERLAQLLVTAGADGQPRKVRLPYRPTEVGEFDYIVELTGLPDEVRGENVRQQRHVSVRKEQIRVLLVQSYPNYEFRYLKHMLERDHTIQLRTVLQESDLEYAEQDKSALRVFPVRREELFDYDVLILGDVNPAFLSSLALADVKAFVEEKGGGLVLIAGPLYMPLEYRDSPLEELLPIDFSAGGGPGPGAIVNEPFQVQPTDEGLAGPTMQLGDTPEETARIWQRLPPLYWFFEMPRLKSAIRWAEHPLRLGADGRKLPLFTMQYVGAGKVLFQATDETWRWRFRVGDAYFARYWVQTIRFLSRAKLLGKDRSAELTVDRKEYRRGDPVRLRVRFLDDRAAPAEDDGVTVVVEHEGDKNRQLQLRRSEGNRGVFEGTLGKPADGRYHVWVAAPAMKGDPPSADFRVVAPPGEMARLQTDTAKLRRASGDTRGRFYTFADAARLLGDLPEGRQVKTDPLPPIVLWNKWPLLLAFLTLVVGEWVLRKRRGML